MSRSTTERERVLNRFRAKKSYLIRKKGLSEAEAIEKAQHILKDLDDNAQISTKQTPSRRLMLVQDPSPDEIREEIERQKARGSFTEAPILMSSVEKPEQTVERRVKDSTLRVTETQNTEPQPRSADRRETQSAETVGALFYALIVAIASWLLISSSLEVFGRGPEGWGKAIILELGILGLAVSKTKSGSSLKEIAGFLLSKATLIFLVILSFAVLHTGVESQRSEGLTTAESTSRTLTELIAERDLWQKTYDDYAENRITDRRDAMKEISRLNAEIRAERRAVFRSSASAVIDMKSNTEMMVRAALLLLNIIFGHKLAQIVTTIKWPPMREGQPAT